MEKNTAIEREFINLGPLFVLTGQFVVLWIELRFKFSYKNKSLQNVNRY